LEVASFECHPAAGAEAPDERRVLEDVELDGGRDGDVGTLLGGSERSMSRNSWW